MCKKNLLMKFITILLGLLKKSQTEKKTIIKKEERYPLMGITIDFLLNEYKGKLNNLSKEILFIDLF
jgi:hypothetical protein